MGSDNVDIILQARPITTSKINLDGGITLIPVDRSNEKQIPSVVLRMTECTSTWPPSH